jgi:hypothetical protein
MGEGKVGKDVPRSLRLAEELAVPAWLRREVGACRLIPVELVVVVTQEGPQIK